MMPGWIVDNGSWLTKVSCPAYVLDAKRSKEKSVLFWKVENDDDNRERCTM